MANPAPTTTGNGGLFQDMTEFNIALYKAETAGATPTEIAEIHERAKKSQILGS